MYRCCHDTYNTAHCSVFLTLEQRSLEGSERKYSLSSWGSTLALAIALECSALWRPIWPRAQAAAAKMCSSFSSLRVMANWTSPFEGGREKGRGREGARGRERGSVREEWRRERWKRLSQHLRYSITQMLYTHSQPCEERLTDKLTGNTMA